MPGIKKGIKVGKYTHKYLSTPLTTPLWPWVDWILLEIRNSLQNPTVIRQRAGFVNCDGFVVDLDGINPIMFNAPPGNYYIVVKHRNHLEIMSASEVELPNSNFN